MPIKILSKELINQIAAGEVVERPASVVKELVENSLDAGAKNIGVEIENGGTNFIKIVDDGSGMNREDAQLSVLEHATSKLGSIDDLYKISTLGFRGEALSSISAVSEFILVTKNSDSIAGTQVSVKNGEVVVEDVGAAVGTTITVKNLFYNIPARKKYLKTAVTEFNHIVDLFLNYCLAYPSVSWKLTHNGKLVYQFPAGSLVQRVSDVLGDEVCENLFEVDTKLNGLTVRGHLGKPQIARNNRKLQYLFVNGRPVNEFIAAKNIKDAFGSLIPRDYYPVYVLNLHIDPEFVDVNVHPRKLEVRFSEPQLIYRTLYQAVAMILDEQELSRQVNSTELKQFVPLKEVLTQGFAFNKQSVEARFIAPHERNMVPTTPSVETQNFASREGTFSPNPPSAEIPSTQPAATTINREVFIPEYKILGQIQDSYIVVETANSLKIYDQHASSERVQYEKIKREWQIGRIASQKMLIEQNIELSPVEARLINDNLELFQKLGFDISVFGANNFAIAALPTLFTNANAQEIILQIVGELTESIMTLEKISEPVDKIFKMMACRSAIKFGDRLSVSGMEALINDLEKLDNQYTCVHGRPCILEFTFNEFKKLFKRN
ncbi:MAG: DNA mismatch repair endonuclease MutL [Patescibacteria group bacterium]